MFGMLSKVDKKIDYSRLVCAHSDGKIFFDFGKFRRVEHFFYDITSGRITIKQAKGKENEMNKLKSSLEKYKPTNKNKKISRSDVLDNAERFVNGRNLIIKHFMWYFFIV